MLGGTLNVKSRLGAGSSFTFDIEIEPIDTTQLHDAPVHAILKNKRVLIVDDNATNRKILMEQLGQWGMVTQQAKDAPTALTIVEKNRQFDVAIVDMQMPGMNGLELAQLLRKTRTLENLSIILQTSVDCPKNKATLENYNIDHYMTKPIKQSQLQQVLVDLFSKKPVDEQTLNSALDSEMAKKYPRDILVAEDNKANEIFIIRLLQNLGYAPDIVSNGRDVLQALERKHYDLILMDIQMPDMDGIEAARHISAQMNPQHRPNIIALTAHAMPGDREKFLNAGMTGYLSKPLNINKLIEAVQNSVAQTPLVIEAPFHHFSDMENSINADYIRSMMGLTSESDDILLELLDTFLSETTELWQELEDGLALKNFDQIHRAAHTIKSSSEIIGAQRFSKLAAALIEPAQARDSLKVSMILDNMKTEKNSIFAETHLLCKELGATVKKSAHDKIEQR